MHHVQTSSRLALFAASFLLHPSSFILAQGTLTPPGPPAPTMKTLDQIEPRIAINATNTPGDADSLFKINQPGSYYLTGNVTGVPGKMGIEIGVPADGSGVTIDLVGFELAGVPGSLDGIAATGPDTRNIAIRNGTIRDWDGDGIDLSNSRNNLLIEIRAQANEFGILAGAGSTLTRCTAYLNASSGIVAGSGSTLDTCTAADNLNSGIVADEDSTLTGCTANGNAHWGIYGFNACTIKGCTARSNGIDGIRSESGGTITACTAQFNAVDGIQGTDSTITGCTARRNTGDGIEAGFGSTITGCTVSLNIGNGIIGDGCTITGCTVRLNTLNGIRIFNNSRVIDNTCDANGAGAGLFSGIYTNASGNRIEGNSVTGNDFGIFLDGPVIGNLVIRNHARTNTTNYTFPTSGNFIGTQIGTSGAMNAATNSLINISN